MRNSSSKELQDGAILDSYDEMLKRLDGMLSSSCEIPDYIRSLEIRA